MASHHRQPRFAVYLRSSAGPTWHRDRVRVEVIGAADDASAASDARAQLVARFSDRPASAWYAERVEAVA